MIVDKIRAASDEANGGQAVVREPSSPADVSDEDELPLLEQAKKSLAQLYRLLLVESDLSLLPAYITVVT